jgi:limonene-1,2-epoxide hydrolase
MDIERNATVPARSAGPLTAAEFVDVFAHGWALPKPEPFLDYFLPLVHPEATFVQPIFPTAHGVDGVERLFRQLFIQIPDLTAEVQRSAVSGDTIYIESLCTGTLGRKPVRFAVCDFFHIYEDLIFERRSFSDPLPVLLATVRRPTSWNRALRMVAHRQRA